MRYLTADIGSTYTKVTAIETEPAQILGTAASFTTIETDVMEGLNNALSELRTRVGDEWSHDRFLCCSSAAGGLKMVASGLVPELTAKAARMAASSAGAKVMKTYAYKINTSEAKEIEQIAPDIVLLCGGTDGGNTETILHNADKLSQIPGHFTIVVAGNKSAQEEIRVVLERHQKPFVITENVMPNFNELNIEPAKKAIMQLFIDRIIEAKGLSHAQEMADMEIIPTPLAVLNACTLLSQGTADTDGIGDLMAVDLGGATTDIYSIAKGEPSASNIVQRGIPEPFSKRTVEGDLGMRYSLLSLAEEMDLRAAAREVGVEADELQAWVEACTATPSRRAQNEREASMEVALAKGAVRIATDRHAGKLQSVYTPMGQLFTIVGKDLTKTPMVLGIGGALIHSQDPRFILQGAAYDPAKYEYAKPKEPTYLLDKTYIMAAMGLLSHEAPDTALTILKHELLTL